MQTSQCNVGDKMKINDGIMQSFDHTVLPTSLSLEKTGVGLRGERGSCSKRKIGGGGGI